MTKGQRAMAVAMVYPKAAKLRRNGSSSLNLSKTDFDGSNVSRARTVLEWRPAQGKKQHEIATEIGVSQQHVSRLTRPTSKHKSGNRNAVSLHPDATKAADR